MKRTFPGLGFLIPLLLLIIGVLIVDGLVWAHGGHGKPELQFKVVPTKIESPSKVIIKMGDIQITRRDFFDYIRHVAALQIKADLLQRNFLLHYWVVEGVSRYYPTDINDFMKRLMIIGPDSPDFAPLMNDWAEKQAGLFPRILHFYKKAQAQGKHDDSGIISVLQSFTQHVKMDFMEELASFGRMTPTRAGLQDFVRDLPTGDRDNIERHYTNPNEVKPFQRKEGRKRWIKYRRDLLKNTPHEKSYEQVTSLEVPPDTPIAKINQHTVTMADFLAIYGPIPNDVNWNNIKRSRINKLILAYAMGDEADRLRILPLRFQSKIALTEKLYLASDQMVHDIGPISLRENNPTIDFQFFRKIVYFQNLMKFEKTFIAESAKIPDFQNCWIDRDYLARVEWVIQQAYTPEQASYF